MIDLEIYDKKNSGNAFERFHFPVLTVNKGGYSYFNVECDKLFVGKTKWIIARDRNSDQWYVAFLSEMANVRGFSLKRNPRQKNNVNGSYCKTFLAKYPEFKIGNYKICIEDMKVIKDIEWFPLDFLTPLFER